MTTVIFIEPDGAEYPIAVKSGTTFEGEGFTVTVSPAEGDQQRRPANVLVRDAAGKSQSYSGNWICG